MVTHDDARAHMPEFDAFRDGETGRLYRRGDAASLADVVCQCLGDRPGCRRMGDRARRIAREEYNVDVMTERFVEMAKRARARGQARADLSSVGLMA